MKRILLLLCLLTALGTCLVGNISPAEAASDVSFKVTDVVAKGNTLTFTGNFINRSENFQRVTKLDFKYLLSDEDGYPLLHGTQRINDLKVDVGGDPVPFSFTVDNIHASEYATSDLSVWKIDADVTIE